jgi:hypothetical protein
VKPSIGRIVHYTNLGDRDGRFQPEAQAALITKVLPKLLNEGESRDAEDSYFVSLRIFYEDGEFNMKSAPFTTAKAGSEEARGKWCWPERV